MMKTFCGSGSEGNNTIFSSPLKLGLALNDLQQRSPSNTHSNVRRRIEDVSRSSEREAIGHCEGAMCKSDECGSDRCPDGASNGCLKGRGGQVNINNNSDWSSVEAKCPFGAGETDDALRYRGKNAKDLNLALDMSPRMRELLEGLNAPGDSGNSPEEAPEWLDRALFDRGRQFYQRFLFCIFFSDMLALLMMFTVKRILRPLIYTGRSDTPQRAFRRYVSTILHVVAWYRGDVWDPSDAAHRDVLSVRSIHNRSAQMLNSSTQHEKVAIVDVRAKGHQEPQCPFNHALRADLKTHLAKGFVLETPQDPPLYISQWDMLVTQYSFLGVLVAHPLRMGAWWASEEDLKGFIHFWRGIGWLLGVEDKYNFCSGSFEETRRLCLEMERLLVVPGLADADWNCEHMSTSLVTGINDMIPALSYPAMFRFLADTLGIAVPSFVARMSPKHTFQYWFMRFVFHVLFVVPGVLFLFNQLLQLALFLVQRWRPEWGRKADNFNVKSFPHVYA